jgi:YesN/AraC family two-component response regulator
MQLVREYLKYRDVTKSNQILDIDNFIPAEQIAYFPVQIETQIVQAIQLGQAEEALDLLRSFWENVERESKVEMEILLDMQILLGSIEHAILKAGFHPYNLYKGKNLFDELNQLQNKDEILGWFSESVIAPYLQEVKATQSLKKKQMIDKVLDLIQREYMNDISLEQCAEHVGTLPYTLSKNFKQITGTTFVAYITCLKIEKCKELIIHTNLLLNEVAKEVGWHPAYFNKIFKTHEGITPGQFRDKYSQ